MICKKCGNKISEDAKSCQVCGEPVTAGFMQLSRKNEWIIAGIILFLAVVGIGIGLAMQSKPGQQAKTEVAQKIEKKNDANTVNESLNKIKVNVEIDDGVFKEGKQKFIVTVKNTSDYTFLGSVTISGTGISIMDIPMIDVKLQPDESITTFSFGKVDSSTKFQSSIKGTFKKVEIQHDLGLDYKIIKKVVGEGYATFFVYTEAVDDSTIIAMAKEFKSNYEDKFSIGFQVRFTHKKENPENGDSFAIYARTHTKTLNFSHVLMYDGKNERQIADNL